MYDVKYRSEVYDVAQLISTYEFLGIADSQPAETLKPESYRIEYTAYLDFVPIAKALKIMEDEKVSRHRRLPYTDPVNRTVSSGRPIWAW